MQKKLSILGSGVGSINDIKEIARNGATEHERRKTP
jgi:hypothetical protein